MIRCKYEAEDFGIFGGSSGRECEFDGSSASAGRGKVGRW